VWGEPLAGKSHAAQRGLKKAKKDRFKLQIGTSTALKKAKNKRKNQNPPKTKQGGLEMLPTEHIAHKKGPTWGNPPNFRSTEGGECIGPRVRGEKVGSPKGSGTVGFLKTDNRTSHPIKKTAKK